MQTDISRADFTAHIYSPGGRRMCARIRTYPQPRAVAMAELTVPVGDALLTGAASVYAPEAAHAPQLRAALCAVQCAWRDMRALARPGDMLPARDEGVLRGIYAMGAQAAICPVRAHRSEWAALTAAWRDSGWSAYLLIADGRPQAYAVFSRPAGDGGSPLYARMHECVALPDSGLTCADVLATAQAAGVCAPEGVICASAMTID